MRLPRIPTLWLRIGVAVLLASTVAGLTAAGSGATPATPRGISVADAPPGMNESTFYRLWSGDTDTNTRTPTVGTAGTSRPAMVRRLANATDIPFAHPPPAAGAWNQHTFAAYTPGGTNTSVHPAGATLSDGPYIKDAFVSIYAVQPATRLHENRTTTQYIAPTGEVRAVSDYRVHTPAPDRQGPTRVQWTVLDHNLTAVELTAAGRPLDTAAGHRATLAYSNLTGSQTLTVTATITATVQKTTRDCSQWNTTTTQCTGSWTRSTTTHTTTKTVATSRPVTVSSLDTLSGTRVTFPNETRQGAVVHTPTPWTALAVEDRGRVRSHWWFYTASASGWQTLETTTATHTTQRPSPVQPLRIHAYPSRDTAYTASDGRPTVTIASTWGQRARGPQLPTAIDIAPATTYTRLDSIAVTTPAQTGHAFESVTVDGIVAGQSTTLALPDHRTVHDTRIALTVQASNATQAVVAARVRTASGTPVAAGQVTISGQTTTLNAQGQGTVTLTDPGVVVQGVYQPPAWWRTNHAYQRATTTATLSPGVFDGQQLIRLGVVTGLWFLPVSLLVVGLEYMTNGGLLGLINSR